ncbi:MAG: NAD(P)-dependent oxidoreductase [Bacteroidota bacterium]
MKTIAIIGASGYVGSHLVKVLSQTGKVTAINRSPESIYKKIAGVDYIGINQINGQFDIIINTSFSADKEPQQFEQENVAMLKHIQQMSAPHTHIIHLSSLAVFGFGLDIPVQPVALPNRTDYPYVSSKLHMENVLLEQFPNKQLSIVRLGNVWGPANQSWTQPVADALVWGMPVLHATPSFSNLTFIHNITSYIQFIIQSETQQTFHHLAEHNNITWQQVITELSDHFQYIPQPIETVPFYPKSLAEEVNHAIMLGPVKMLRALKSGRFTASGFPSFLLKALVSVKSIVAQNTTNNPLPPYETDPVFHWVLSASKPFTNCLLEGWTPPYNWEQTSKQTLNWLDEAGY